MNAQERREQLREVFLEARTCTACPQLVASRTQVVFGSGNPDAGLMFVGEAPGANEDREGRPFVGQAGKLLEQLLQEIGLSRDDVFIANVLKCRPPQNRDPLGQEIENCRHWLFSQLALVQPRVVCTLGNFATKLLRDDPTGITRVRGQAEIRVIGPRAVRLLPLLHPAAALYTRSMLALLQEDFAHIPGLLAAEPPPQPDAEVTPEDIEEVASPPARPPVAQAELDSGEPPERVDPGQLGLF